MFASTPIKLVIVAKNLLMYWPLIPMEEIEERICEKISVCFTTIHHWIAQLTGQFLRATDWLGRRPKRDHQFFPPKKQLVIRTESAECILVLWVPVPRHILSKSASQISSGYKCGNILKLKHWLHFYFCVGGSKYPRCWIGRQYMFVHKVPFPRGVIHTNNGNRRQNILGNSKLLWHSF